MACAEQRARYSSVSVRIPTQAHDVAQDSSQRPIVLGKMESHRQNMENPTFALPDFALERHGQGVAEGVAKRRRILGGASKLLLHALPDCLARGAGLNEAPSQDPQVGEHSSERRLGRICEEAIAPRCCFSGRLVVKESKW